jgi:hypothetical protein
MGPHPVCEAETARLGAAFDAAVARGVYDAQGYTPRERAARAKQTIVNDSKLSSPRRVTKGHRMGARRRTETDYRHDAELLKVATVLLTQIRTRHPEQRGSILAAEALLGTTGTALLDRASALAKEPVGTNDSGD